MRILHTSDWHVGKLIRGRSREDEHRAVLAEIASIAQTESVDLVVVVGDLFETAAPSPSSEQVVYEALLALSAVAPVVVVAGNHDNPHRLRAVAPLLTLGRVHVVDRVVSPDAGGVLDLDVDGVTARLALVPFVSKRGIVKARALMADDAYQLQQAYDERMRAVVGALCDGFDAGTVNLVLAHAFVSGAKAGGGERDAHLHLDYAIGAQAFPATAQYVALGHLHRPQDIAGPTRIRYSGSPLQLDFGEGADDKSVTIVDVAPKKPASITEVPLTAGRRLRTLRGTMADLRAAAGTTGDDHLRVIVRERRSAGLAEEVRELFEHCVDVLIEPPDEDRSEAPAVTRNLRAAPGELFGAYLRDAGIDDARLVPAFEALYDEVSP